MEPEDKELPFQVPAFKLEYVAFDVQKMRKKGNGSVLAGKDFGDLEELTEKAVEWVKSKHRNLGYRCEIQPMVNPDVYDRFVRKIFYAPAEKSVLIQDMTSVIRERISIEEEAVPGEPATPKILTLADA